jgi:hypothetical protein
MELHMAYHEMRRLQIKIAECKSASETATDPEEKSAYLIIAAVHEKKLAVATKEITEKIAVAMTESAVAAHT